MRKQNDYKNKISLWEKYLTKEIGIEFKACLYFYCILFFYCIYRICTGNLEANIIHMAQMIFLTYCMGYLQVFVLFNFDETDCVGIKEALSMMLCSLLYAATSYLGKWFEGRFILSVGFFAYMLFAYGCASWVYKLKREIDGKILNEELKAFQERNGDHNGK